MSVLPRNLRKPTPRRVACWRRDFDRTWPELGRALYNDVWWEGRLDAAEGAIGA